MNPVAVGKNTESSEHPGKSPRALFSQAGRSAELKWFQMLLWISSGTVIFHPGENN